jgi:acyl-CoA hydrolase
MLARALFALAVVATTVLAADTHEIKLLRPVKAGDRFDISAKVAYEDNMKTSFDGREVESDETVVACRMTGALTVVAVTKKGLPSAIRLKVKTVECVRGGQPAGIFNEGDELFLRRDEPENESKVNGEAADDVQAQLIESLLTVQAEDEVSDEDIFGTSEKVAVGAEWPVNAKAAVASLARSGVTGIDPAGVSGHAKLLMLGEFDRQPAYSVRMDAKIEGKGVSLTNLPENVKGRRFHSEYTVEMDVPVDPKSTAGRTKGMAKMEVDAAGTEEFDGKKVDVAVKIERRVASEIIATQAK